MESTFNLLIEESIWRHIDSRATITPIWNHIKAIKTRCKQQDILLVPTTKTVTLKIISLIRMTMKIVMLILMTRIVSIDEKVIERLIDSWLSDLKKNVVVIQNSKSLKLEVNPSHFM